MMRILHLVDIRFDIVEALLADDRRMLERRPRGYQEDEEVGLTVHY